MDSKFSLCYVSRDYSWVTGDVAQLVECLPSLHKALSTVPPLRKLGMVACMSVLTLRIWSQKGQERVQRQPGIHETLEFISQASPFHLKYE